VVALSGSRKEEVEFFVAFAAGVRVEGGGRPAEEGNAVDSSHGIWETGESRIIKEHRECANVRDVAGT
jgi:hypothetical protein